LELTGHVQSCNAIALPPVKQFCVAGSAANLSAGAPVTLIDIFRAILITSVFPPVTVTVLPWTPRPLCSTPPNYKKHSSHSKLHNIYRYETLVQSTATQLHNVTAKWIILLCTQSSKFENGKFVPSARKDKAQQHIILTWEIDGVQWPCPCRFTQRTPSP
jgi:hypothetical protein